MYLFCSRGQYNLHAEYGGHEMYKANYKFYRLHMLHVKFYPDCLIITPELVEFVQLSKIVEDFLTTSNNHDDCYVLF